MNYEMKSKDVVSIYEQLTSLGVKIWIGGGWSVDALLGKQTRIHEDLDVYIQEKDLENLREYLARHEYSEVPRDDTCDWNFVLGDRMGHTIDVHSVRFNDAGDATYGPIERSEVFTKSDLSGEGVIGGIKVKCNSSEFLVSSISP